VLLQPGPLRRRLVGPVVPHTGILAVPGDARSEDMPTRGYTIQKDDYLKRLSRIEGQVRGIKRMVDEDTYCIDVLTQVSAATRALQSVAVGLLDEHVRHCVRNAATDDPAKADEMVTEALRAIERLIKA
jgi:CsoR family transcriptional regulator, copper-sensing transcriptional repressor